ncbi:hypothetical protein G7K_0071-t1 [Saitoella complicata NRRL Y-17804]|uniref:Uncharacterized protein n=1 Tax=Saitoella complicata (strain BCRC 22490 / CBS 7301 / JCM 7358 / NBRC 10748 / NRRL Y-17804) TaxID=698492 RepID=A0A0E9N7A9_SAICN|nr:hypothetical protein G7K_0071-t1 [Saitoella complicata NRRL Y-17804]
MGLLEAASARSRPECEAKHQTRTPSTVRARSPTNLGPKGSYFRSLYCRFRAGSNDTGHAVVRRSTPAALGVRYLGI